MTEESAVPQDNKKLVGYNKLSDEQISKMNELKKLSACFIEVLNYEGIDQKWREAAKMSMQKAAMFGVRAIAKPSDDY